MFDISALKELKLSELQEIAKTAKTIKFNGVKKETLIGLILEHQAATTKVVDTVISNDIVDAEKPKRVRIVPNKKVKDVDDKPTLFQNEQTIDKVESANSKTLETNSATQLVEAKDIENNDGSKKADKVVKFNKSAYEKKLALKKEKGNAKTAEVVTEEAVTSEAVAVEGVLEEKISEEKTKDVNEPLVPAKKNKPKSVKKNKTVIQIRILIKIKMGIRMGTQILKTKKTISKMPILNLTV